MWRLLQCIYTDTGVIRCQVLEGRRSDLVLNRDARAAELNLESAETKMDTYEATRIVFTRIQSIEPENVSKIIGYLLLQDLGDQEMIRLAFGPNTLLQSMISKAKTELGLSSPSSVQSPLRYTQISNLLSRPFASSAPNSFHGGAQQDSTLLTHHEVLNTNRFATDEHNNLINLSRQQSLPSDHKFPDYHEQLLNLRDDCQLQDQLFYHTENLDSYSLPNDSHVYTEMLAFLNGNKPGPNHRRSYSMTDVSVSCEPVSWKPCMYFARGYCKHGSGCRFTHSYSRSENVSSSIPMDSRFEEAFSVESLERLELELQELLRGRRAPVSIASLPQLYYERFGKTLQAEGYLTESQRHGKAGYSLTNLLARLKSTVSLIDRPHGQHAIVLAEDANRFTTYRPNERDPYHLSGVSSGSRQIYMTFPAESTFTEEDVSNYFRIYGPVEDVRIPYQQKRMFGFVTYVYPETVKLILAKGNPHYVCGARVLVKPYKERNKHGDRKNGDRGEQYARYLLPSYNVDSKDYDLCPAPRLFQSSELIRRHVEEQEQAIELERLRLTELHLADHAQRTQNSKTRQQQNSFPNGLLNVEEEEETKVSEELNSFEPPTDHFGYLLDVLDSEQNHEVEPKQQQKADNEDECNGHNLPDSPFAFSNAIKALPHPEKTSNFSFFDNNPAQESSTSIMT